MKNALHFSKLEVDRTIPDIMFCLSIKEDMTWMVSSCGVEITSGSFIDSLPPKLDTVLQVISVTFEYNLALSTEQLAPLKQSAIEVEALQTCHWL